MERLNPAAWPLPLQELPPQTALVGGAIRDALLGRLAARPDLDLVVPEGAIPLCQRLARQLGGRAVVLDRERDIARLVLRGWSFDLAAWEGGSLAADLGRRDYSINAIALPLSPGATLLDPCNGLVSLQQRQLRAISAANLRSDPLRLLRGLRLACELQFDLDSQTQGWIGDQRARLGAVASERVLAELEKLACAPLGHQGLLAVLESGLLEPWLQPGSALEPPLRQLGPSQAQALGLTPEEQARALPLARLTCLADAAALERLRSSRALQKRIAQLRQGLALLAGRPIETLPDAPRFALHRLLEADLPALLLLLPPSAQLQDLVRRWRDPGDPLCHPRPPLDGVTLQQQLDLPAGPQLGRLLNHLSLERAVGRLPLKASRSEVLTAARQWLERQR